MACPSGVRVGITELGDAALSYDWVDRLDDLAFAVLITKRLSNRFIAEVAARPGKLIVHVTCTGFGGTAVEPRVRPLAWTRAQFDRLAAVLPPDRTVLRIDPVIPTQKGLGVARAVLDAFADSAVTRVRFSLIDMYRHAADRFQAAGLPHPYGGSFNPSAEMRRAATRLFAAYGTRYRIESCAEPGGWQAGCISSRDAAACGLPDLPLGECASRRKGCMCPTAKTELLRRAPEPCAHGCLYCYWKDRQAR